MNTSSPSPSNSGLKRSLSYRDLVFYGLAYTAPITPLTMFGFVWGASNGLIVLAFLLGALCVYFTASSYAVMSDIMPTAGSVYGYTSSALGPFAGFIAGWMILLDYLLVPAFIYGMIAVSLEELVPNSDRASWVVLAVAVTFAINWFGISVTSRVSLVSAALQLLLVGGVVGFAILALKAGQGHGGLTLTPVFSVAKFSVGAVLGATSICVMSYLGFDAVSTLAEEVKGGDRKVVGKAILTNFAVTGITFAITTWTLADLLAEIKFKDPAAAIFEIFTLFSGPQAAIALGWFLVVVVGVPNVLPMQAGVARVLFAMGRDRSLPAFLGKVHKKHGGPHVAMIVSSAVSLSIALLMRNQLDNLATLISMGALAGFTFLHLSLFRHCRNREGRQWWAHIAVPLIGIAVVLTILVNLNMQAKIVGGCWLAAGVAYRLLFWRRHVAAATVEPAEIRLGDSVAESCAGTD